MKIAIASVGKDENSEVSSRGGRSPYYLIFDENGKLAETLSNPFTMGSGGAGFAVAKMLADKDVNVVIAGAVGGNMSSTLEQRGVKYHEASGNIKTALNDFLNGK